MFFQCFLLILYHQHALLPQLHFVENDFVSTDAKELLFFNWWSSIEITENLQTLMKTKGILKQKH